MSWTTLAFDRVGTLNNTNDLSTYTVSLATISANSFVNVGVITGRTGGATTPTFTGPAGMVIQATGTAVQQDITKVQLGFGMPNATIPTGSILTIDYGGTAQGVCIAQVNAWSGATTSGTSGADAVSRTSYRAQAGTNSVTLTLPTASNASNAIWGMWAIEGGAATVWTSPNRLTSGISQGQVTPATSASDQYALSGSFTTVGYTASGSASAMVGAIMEIQADLTDAGGGGGGTVVGSNTALRNRRRRRG